MSLTTKKTFTNSSKGIFLPLMQLDGTENMALDMLLLEKLIRAKDIPFALRFYKWNQSWLSIGYNQRVIPERWINLAKKNKIKLVRRPSGGQSVLHSGGLTYCIVWQKPPRKKQESYYIINKWLIDGFAKLGVTLNFGKQANNINSNNCFSTSTYADLIDQNGIKRIGSAQRWKKGSLLQHGEILLDPPKDLWEDVYNTRSPSSLNNSFPRNDLYNILYEELICYLPGLKLENYILSNKELQTIKSNSSDYLVNSGEGFTNPADNIDLTTSGNNNPKG